MYSALETAPGKRRIVYGFLPEKRAAAFSHRAAAAASVAGYSHSSAPRFSRRRPLK